MKELIFDSHAHYDDKTFDKDRDRLLAGLALKGVGNVMNVSANAGDISDILALAEKYDFIYASTGVHPSEVYALEGDEALWQQVINAADHPKVRAVGEIGLDYHYEDTDKVLQKKWFIKQLELARERALPIIVHSRDAAADTLDIITEYGKGLAGVIHCFSYEKEMAARYLDMGYYIGIGGVLTFKNARKLKEVAALAPLERILTETDCPYLAPVPHRGERNDSTLLELVVNELSEIKGIEREEVISVTAHNACQLYRID